MASDLPVEGVDSIPRDLPVEDPDVVTYLATKIRRLERWLLGELRHGRAERRLLEELVNIKEEDLEFHRQRLDATLKQVRRLRSELGESRKELLERRRLLSQAFVDNVRLRADNKELRSMVQIRSLETYHSKKTNDVFIQYTDTDL
ncbi:uncharacterized protein LOC113209393 [Frankliniella occidentalis]|uniref:Uncharacterized protein LOC113209393 n=1 Tax=Frankliniella occidentalis TaxID=133901 RepID=A0A6J1SMZ8_FRAOC|nr:uncharacterized protein LOC113209393 [Frankliniella occidentalis]